MNNLPDAPPPTDGPVPPDAGRACIVPIGAGTVHSSNIAAAETWTEAASPHLIMGDTTVGAAVTIEPCAVVRISGGKTVTINSTGSITANGVAGLPVTIERLEPATAYGPIRAIAGTLSLSYTNVTGGGNPLGGPIAVSTAILMQRSVSVTTGALHMDHVTIMGSSSQGVTLAGVAGFDATSDQLTIQGAAGYPVLTAPNLLGSIPAGTYTGNTNNAVMIDDSGGQITTTQTLHDRGIPYIVGDAAGGQLDVVSFTPPVPVLTIEPGVVLKFQSAGRMRIDSNGGSATPAKGALIAIGTPAKPIVFTSVAATPAAGAWIGIYFSGEMNAATRIQYARIEYAGGPTATGSNSCTYAGRVGQNDAAIRIFGTPQPLTQFVTDTEIIASARDGIDRGWQSDLPLDFLPNNVFTGVAGCKQTLPRPSLSACPATPPCP